MDAADAEVGDLDARRDRRRIEAAGHLDPEAVVAEEDVADPCHQDPDGRPTAGLTAVGRTSTSSGWK